MKEKFIELLMSIPQEDAEIDETAGNILSLLYPDAKVDIQGFEQTQITNGSVDLAITNVPFVTGDAELDAKFVKESTEAGFINLKGHKTVGGMRASIYNAMPVEGVEKLVAFMKEFAQNNPKIQN